MSKLLVITCVVVVLEVWIGPLLLAPHCQEPSKGWEANSLHLHLVHPASGRTPEGAAYPHAGLNPFLLQARQSERRAWWSDGFKVLFDALHNCRRIQGQVVVYCCCSGEPICSLIPYHS